MDLRYIVGIVVFATLAVAAGIMLPAGKQPPMPMQPWQVTTNPDGSTSVFGLWLGKSTLQQAEQAFRSQAQVTLFQSAKDNSPGKIEAFFDRVNVRGLSARVVMVLDVTPEQFQAMYDRGVRISTLGDGSRKITLSGEDRRRVRQAVIDSITYLPPIRLETQWIRQRFGEPAQKVSDNDGNVIHWLYPDKGLDVVLDEQGNAVLQYVSPSDFAQLVAPLP
ncbi:MAG: hypothetical protein PVJ39_19315 [Gammaproteobacteria bacterium]|jgi:hypothetical protein